MKENTPLRSGNYEESFYKTASTEECVRNIQRKFFRYRLVLTAELACILLIAANFVLQWHWPVALVVLFCVLAAVGFMFLRGCKVILYQLPEGILYTDCEAEKYAALLQLLSENAKKQQKLMIDIQLCSALYAAGRYEEAGAVLERIEPKIRSGMATFVIDLHAKLDAAAEDYSRYPEYISRLKKMYEQYKNNDRAVAQIIGTLDSVEFYQNLHEGKLDACRKTLAIWNSVAENNYQKVYTSFLLGKVLYGVDNRAAEEHFKFAIQNGGTTIQAVLAAEYLKTL